MFVTSSKILGEVVPEKPWTLISLCITLELEMEKGGEKEVKRGQNKFQP